MHDKVSVIFHHQFVQFGSPRVQGLVNFARRCTASNICYRSYLQVITLVQILINIAGSCFVKYATLDEADRAIKALSNQYTFPGVRTILPMMDDLKHFFLLYILLF